jgi:hypothetical protein
MSTPDDGPSDDFFESLMAEYTNSWDREDIDAIEGFYHYPFFSYKDGAVEVYPGAEEGAKSSSIVPRRASGSTTVSTFQRTSKPSASERCHLSRTVCSGRFWY